MNSLKRSHRSAFVKRRLVTLPRSRRLPDGPVRGRAPADLDGQIAMHCNHCLNAMLRHRRTTRKDGNNHVEDTEVETHRCSPESADLGADDRRKLAGKGEAVRQHDGTSQSRSAEWTMVPMSETTTRFWTSSTPDASSATRQAEWAGLRSRRWAGRRCSPRSPYPTRPLQPPTDHFEGSYQGSTTCSSSLIAPHRLVGASGGPRTKP